MQPHSKSRSFTVKNLPVRLHQRLKQRAAANQRSINSEIIACLESSLGARAVDPATLLAEARAFRGQFAWQTHDAEIDRYKRQGRR